MVSILEFLGTNCQDDLVNFYNRLGVPNTLIWHKERKLPADTKLAIIAGGFSYGDYLRSGAIASKCNSILALKDYINNGGVVLGICNGFQILCEARILPGVLLRNNSLTFLSKNVELIVNNNDNNLLKKYYLNQRITIPVAHAEGNYQVDSKNLESMKENNQIILKYSQNINGSIDNIAGISNYEKNVFALMPHPERAVNLKSINSLHDDFSYRNMDGLLMLKTLV